MGVGGRGSVPGAAVGKTHGANKQTQDNDHGKRHTEMIEAGKRATREDVCLNVARIRERPLSS